MARVRLSRKIFFNAARSLWRSDWSAERNLAAFGPESPFGYGHNYALEVEVDGEIDAEKGMVVNLTDLDRILKEEIDRPLDHRNLNRDVPAFERVVPTFENLAAWIWKALESRLAREGWNCRLSRVRLSPGADLRVEIER